MGTEKICSAATMTPGQQHHHRSRPPPVPPRPQHLIPVKMMSKYSSMPDILSGWKRDTNPDLLKLSGGRGGYSKRSIVDVIRPDCVKVKTSGGGGGAYPSMLAASNEYLSAAEKTFMSNYRDVRCNGNNYTMLPIRGSTKAAGVVVPVDKSHKHNGMGIVIAGDGVGNLSYQHYQHQHQHQQQPPPPPQQLHVNGKSSKKFSCIPSRSNSKKKQQQKNNEHHIEAGNRYGGKSANNASANGQISQTSWYVEDMQLSKCEINVNNAPPPPPTSMTMTTTGDSPATTAIVPNYGRYANAPSVGVVDSRLFHSGSNHSGNGGTKDSVNDVSQQRTYRNKQQQQQRYQQVAQASQPQSPLPRALPRTMMSSPSLSSLPPLPKSLSDASLLWEPTSANKKVSAYPVSLSPARSSSSSSSSRGSSSSSSGGRRIVHPKVPPPAVPRSNSVSINGGGGGGGNNSSSSSSSDDHPKISAVYVNTSSVVDGARGVAAGLADADAAATISTGDERPLPPPPPPPRKPTSLDMKLSILRKEMHVLRQMDLSLLSQLWSLNESIHEFRQKQELLALNSPYLNSSDEEDSGCYHSNISSQGMVTSNHHNTLGSCSSRSSVSAGRSIRRDAAKP